MIIQETSAKVSAKDLSSEMLKFVTVPGGHCTLESFCRMQPTDRKEGITDPVVVRVTVSVESDMETQNFFNETLYLEETFADKCELPAIIFLGVIIATAIISSFNF